MTATAIATATALETLKRIAKPIPFAPNDEPEAELSNILTLLKSERFKEATERVDRMLVMKLVAEASHDLQERIDELDHEIDELDHEIEGLGDENSSLQSEKDDLEDKVAELETKISKLEDEIEELKGAGA